MQLDLAGRDDQMACMHDSDAINPLLADTEPADHLPAGRATAFAFAAMLVANMALALGPLFVRLTDVGPIAAGFWRLTLAVPPLLLLCGVARQPLPAMSLRLWGAVTLGGLFFAADLAAWHVGIHHTTLANATLFGNASALLFPIYGFIVARALPGRAQSLAFALATLGAVLLLGRSYQLSPENLLGDLFCILAGLFYTCYFIAMGSVRGSVQPLPTILVSTLFGLGPLLIFAWLMGETIWPGHWTPLVLLALCSQVIGQGLLIYAIGHLPPLVFGLGLLTQPIVSATIGWTLYDERLGAVDIAGAMAIAAALVLVRRTERR